MNAVANVEHRESTPIDALKNQLTRRAEEFKMVLPAHITPEKFQRVIATAAIQNPQLLGCDRQSLLLAGMKLAQDGLLPDGREAALVPFKSWNRETRENIWLVQAMPMVYGLRKKILQSGEVLSVETGVVYLADLESGHFLYEIGMDPPIRYRPNLLLPIEETADEKIVAAYSIAKLKNEAGGDPYWSVEVMRRAEIDKVRQASQTGALGKKTRDGKAIPAKGPWVDWYGEMARKTVLRRHAKVLPMSGDILETFERDIQSERAAESAAAFLAVEAEGPKVLPSAEELAGRIVDNGEIADAETGEVIQRDSRGMTEVDEDTARQLDQGNDGTLSDDNPNAQEGRDDSQRGEQHTEHDADFVGAKPASAQRGQTWFNPEDGKLRYAHQTQNGIKWYLQPQKDDASADKATPAADQQQEGLPLALQLRNELDEIETLDALNAFRTRFSQVKGDLSDGDRRALGDSIATLNNELS